jgi:hypothetical protein
MHESLILGLTLVVKFISYAFFKKYLFPMFIQADEVEVVLASTKQILNQFL